MALGNSSAATGKAYVFRGKIQTINHARRSFTLLSEKKAYVFKVTPETKITQGGASVKFGNVWRGQNAEVTMKVGPAGEGIAYLIKLVRPDEAILLSVLAGTTPGGKSLSAEQMKPLILREVWAPGVASVYWHLKLGVFLLAVRGDGTVANVETLQSTSHPLLDAEIVRAFMKWRFRPNSVKEVRLPAYYVWRR